MKPITNSITLTILILLLMRAANASEAFSADHYLEEGLKRYNQGAFKHAIINELEAARFFKENGELGKQAEALINLSHAYQSLGQYSNALAKLEEALPIAEKIDGGNLKAIILSNLGNVCIYINQYDKAETFLQESLLLAKNDNNRNVMPYVLNNLGNLYVSLEKFSEAISAYEESISLADHAHNLQLVARASANCAKAYLLNNNIGKTNEYLHLSLEKHLKLVDSHDKAFGLINIGLSYGEALALNPKKEAEYRLSAYKAFNKAASVAEAINDYQASSYAFGYIGKLYEGEKRYHEALQLTRSALFRAQQANAPETLYLWQWQTGRLLKAQGKTNDAISSYENAVYTLQSIRRGMSDGCDHCNNTTFSESIEPVFFGLADLLLLQAATLDKQDDVEICLIKARETIELLKAEELRDYFQDPCIDAYQAKIKSLDTISKNSAVIYAISLPDRLEILLSMSSGMKRFSVNVTADEFTREVTLFRTRIEKRTTRQFMVQAQRLYNWLIHPIDEELVSHKIDTLIFVPDRKLRVVPMAALHDGCQFLINKYALVTTQGLSVTDTQPITREGSDLLLAGLTEAVQGFPALLNVNKEMDDIHNLYGGEVLKNEKFVIQNMKKELADTPYSIVHIASHGEFFGKARDTFLLTWDERLNMDSLAQLIKMSRFRKKPVELLTLSACQTASGDDRAALGLAGIAIKAGARSALATLWYVNDEASSKLVVEFYKQLKENSISKSVALQRAQLKLLSDQRYCHPGYWSPFLLIGNWL